MQSGALFANWAALGREAVSDATVLCQLADIADGGGKSVQIGAGEAVRRLMLLREGEAVYCYINYCPHVGTPLDWLPDTFKDPSGRFIQCSTHGALFRVTDGHCIAGPPVGKKLQAVPVAVHDGDVLLKQAR